MILILIKETEEYHGKTTTKIIINSKIKKSTMIFNTEKKKMNVLT